MDWIYKERRFQHYEDGIIDDYRRYIQLAHQTVKKGIINVTNKTSTRLTKDSLIVYSKPEDLMSWLYDVYYKMGLVDFDIVIMQNRFDTIMKVMTFLNDKELPIHLHGMEEGLRTETYQLRKDAILDLADAFAGKVTIQPYPPLVHDETLLFVSLEAEETDQEEETLTVTTTSQMEVVEEGMDAWPVTRIQLSYAGQNSRYFLQHASKRMKALFPLEGKSYMAIVTKN